MPERVGSVDSFDEFFSPNEENLISPSTGIAALIKSQPVVHHRSTNGEVKPNINSKKVPLTTNVKNTSKSVPPKSKSYESDFDDDTSMTGREKHSSLPPPKERLPVIARRDSDSKVKASYATTKHNTRRNEKGLPYIHPMNRRKRIKKSPSKEVKSEIEQRIRSAQQTKVHEVQSRLAELRRQLDEERQESRTLHVIQKREDKALQKHEDQEYEVHKVARDYTQEIEHIKEKIISEREVKSKLEQDLESRDEVLRNQRKQMKFYEKLVEEDNLDEAEQLRERLKEADKKLKKFQEKITNQDKQIENLEKTFRQEINQELIKQRDLKREIDENSKKYTDLLLKVEGRTRQLDTMHIYIQRGGRRPSHSSLSLAKSRSLQSLQDTSPQFREKIIEYDKKRREQQKKEQALKPKLPPPLPIQPPPKPQRKKYVPNIEKKPPKKKVEVPTTRIVPDEKPPTVKVVVPTTRIVPNEKPPTEKVVVEPTRVVQDTKREIVKTEPIQPKGIPPTRRLSTPESIDEDRSEIADASFSKVTHQKTPSSSSSSSPSPPSSPPATIQRSEQHLSKAQIYRRSGTSDSPPIPRKLVPLTTHEPVTTTTVTTLFKHREPSPSPPPKPSLTRQLDDKWPDIIDLDSTKTDLLSELTSNDQKERKPTTTQLAASSALRPSMITFDPSTTTVHQKKTPTATTAYDFEQAVINLHDGKPVTAQPTTTKTSVDPFESLFTTTTTAIPKPTTRVNYRDGPSKTTEDKSDPFDSLFGQPSSAVDTATPFKPAGRQFSSQNDKLQRPKVVTNVPKSIPNRTVVEEIEEFVL